MSIGDIIGVPGCGAGVRDEFAQLTAERDRLAASHVAALEIIDIVVAERDRYREALERISREKDFAGRYVRDIASRALEARS